MEDFEILRPRIIKVGKRNYRKLTLDNESGFETSESETGHFDNEYNDEEPDCDSNIEETSEGYKVSMDVPLELMKFICGERMQKKTRMEQETNTRIKIPKFGVKGPVVITGSTVKDVTSCRHKIDIIVESSRQRLPPTHFISFPLFYKNIIGRFSEFRETALQQCKKSRGVHPSIFVLPEKLHLTISVMVLLTDSEVEYASKLLTTCIEEIRGGELRLDNPIKVKLVGLDYMNDDPSKVDVLYAKVKELDQSGRLQTLADGIQKCFVANAMTKEERSKVKIHATVINSKLRDVEQAGDKKTGTGKGGKPAFNQRTSFDAREILEIFKDFEFGEHHIDCVHLSQRGVFDSNGHYHCCISVPLSRN